MKSVQSFLKIKTLLWPRWLRSVHQTKRASHYELSNSTGLREVSYEDFYKFFEFIHVTSWRDKTAEVLVEEIRNKVTEIGLDDFIQISLEPLQFPHNKYYRLELYVSNLRILNAEQSLSFSADGIQLVGDVRSFDLHLARLVFDDSTSPAKGLMRLKVRSHYDHSDVNLFLTSCCFSSFSLDTSSFKTVRINNSASISPLTVGSETTFLALTSSSIGELKFEDNLKYLQIENSQIARIEETFFVEKIASLGFFYFDSTSTVIHNAYATYQQFRLYANNKQNKILSFILYKKELESFSKESSTDFDTKLLFWLNQVAYHNGTSFIRPLLWLLVFNFIFVSGIFYVESAYYHSLPKEYLFSALNFLPTSSLVDNSFTFISMGLDALRRTISAIFIFLIVSAALRFRFKQ